jgi:hypothetical protein
VAFTFHKRTFLNPEPSTHTSYVLCEVEAGQFGTNLLIVADCKRSIQLEFFLGNAEGRNESLAKIDLFIDVLTGFRDALKTEATLISEHEAD